MQPASMELARGSDPYDLDVMLEIRLLGPLEVVREGELVPIGSPTQRLLLTLLAARRGVVSVDRLVDAVWGGDPPRTARGSLQAYVSRIRKALGSDAIETRSPGYRLRADRTDVQLFETLLRRVGVEPPSQAAARLEEALGLWRGPALGEFADHPHAVAEARRLEEVRGAAREQLGDALLHAEREEEAVAVLESLVADEPLREGAWVLLVRALVRSERKAEALRAAQRCRRELAAVGLEASAALTQAEEEALSARETMAPMGPPDPPSSVTDNLPHPTGSFVGREEEVSRIVERIGRSRCVTLVGPGGVGKTRLAVETARSLRTLPVDGIWLCDLGAADREDAVATAIVEAIGLPPSGDPEERLRDFCAPRSMLLILDNCEHVAHKVARVVGDLLRSSPLLRVLATSRERLEVGGEHLVDVPPLDLDTEAVDLFVDRARAAGRKVGEEDREVVRELCRRLDGLPLAIEMAAAWMRMMSAGELLDRLHRRLELGSAERFPEPRHRTLRDVVAWSHDLLTVGQQRTFRRLSVFAGSFSAEAALHVAGLEPLAEHEIEDLLRALVDRSLLVPVPVPGVGQTRYRMLETVSEYAAEALESSGEETEVVARYAAYFAGLGERIAEGLRGPEEARWAMIAEAEMPNLRAAARQAVEAGFVEEAVRIPAALYLLVLERLRSDVGTWARPCLEVAERERHLLLPVVRAVVGLGELQVGNLEEAERMAEVALSEAEGSPVARFPHQVLVELAFATGEHAEGIHHAKEAFHLAEAAGDHYLAAHAFGDRCLHQGYDGDTEGALRLVAEFRRRARGLGAPTLHADADYYEGELLLDDDPARATHLLDRSLATAASAGSAFVEGAARLSATTARARYGNPGEALAAFGDTIRHWYGRGDWIHQWPTLRNLVVLLARVGRDEAAATLWGGTERAGGEMFGAEGRRVEAARAELVGRLGREAFEAAADRGGGMERDELVSLALAALVDEE